MRIVMLISGSGTTLRNLIQQNAAGKIDVDIRLVISSNPDAAGLRFARDAEIASRIIPRHDFHNAGAFGDAIFQAVREAGVEYVVMGGFLKLVPIPDDFQNRVLNIHPALIPDFCGKGFYGRRVHEAVLASGAKVSGCTVHFVDNQYDHGPIILQRNVPVLDGDTPETLAARVFEAECEAYPEVLRL
ncbi:MAG: phosphoribosylglycinamide formyltransferase, partial [Planctomycetales bacterium]|nr:phosphoribosylglycinamide formyltransferase [Planctomycetales bacterium]